MRAACRSYLVGVVFSLGAVDVVQQLVEVLRRVNDEHLEAQGLELLVAVLLEFGGFLSCALELYENDPASRQEDEAVRQSAVDLAQELEGFAAALLDLFPESGLQCLFAFLVLGCYTFKLWNNSGLKNPLYCLYACLCLPILTYSDINGLK